MDSLLGFYLFAFSKENVLTENNIENGMTSVIIFQIQILNKYGAD
jgi:hypothetical protein